MTTQDLPQPGRTPRLHTVLIASSLEKESHPVVRTGVALARAAGAKVYLLHAALSESFAVGLDAGWMVPGVFQEEAERSRRQLWDQADRLQMDADELAGVEVVSGSPHRTIAETARRIGADLIVLGAGEPGRFGSTADRVVRQAASPVLVVRGDLPVPPRRVLMPVDLSEPSADAFRCGLDLLGQLAADAPAEVEAFFALDFLAPLEFLHPDMPWVTTSQQVERTAALELERFVRENSGAVHAPVRARVRPGDASGEILAELDRQRPDLVILGTHGRSGFHQLLLGSVASAVLRQAPCSVLVVPPSVSRDRTVAEGCAFESCQGALLPPTAARSENDLPRHGASMRAAILALILLALLPAADVLAAVPVSEREALVALYDSTQGIPWTRSGVLGPSGSECGWFGVTCDAGAAHVTGLTLEERTISGTLPEALGDLSELQILDLSGNSLSGPVPASLGRLSQLRRLVLGGNQLSGSIPSELGQLSHLTELTLAANQLSGEIPPTLGDLLALEALLLFNNQLSGTIPQELGRLTNLRSLELERNHLTGSIPDSLGNLTGLLDLSLADNRLTGPIPESLGRLTGLYFLIANNNELSGPIPPSLGDLGILEWLDLSSNNLSGPIPADLSRLGRLRWLRLGNNRLSGSIPPELGELTQLYGLDLSDNQLEGGIPAELGRLTQIFETISLARNRLSGPIPPELASLHPEALDLSGNHLSGSIPEALRGLGVVTLDLSHNALSGTIPEGLGGGRLQRLLLADNLFEPGPIPEWLRAVDLRELDLSSTHRTGQIPEWLGEKAFLSRIRLASNPFDPGPIPEGLRSSEHLYELDLSFTSRTGQIPEWLGEKVSLAVIKLAGNPFDPGPIPPAMARLRSLQVLDLTSTHRTGSIPSDLGSSWIRSVALSENHLTGGLPQELGRFSQLEQLFLDGNRLAGPIPASLRELTRLMNGGIDLRWNALFADKETAAFVNSRQRDGQDFFSTQTRPPRFARVAGATKSSLTLVWNPIRYRADDGFYSVFMARDPRGPFYLAARVSPKTSGSFTLTGLDPAATYHFRLRTVTRPHPHNSNSVLSPLGPVFSSSTEGSTPFEPELSLEHASP